MPMPATDLSIIVPTYHREQELREAVSSALSLTALRIEVIVVDDSPEASAEPVIRAMDDPRLSYRRRQNPVGGRPARIRNEAAAVSKGALLYFLDDDDRTIPDNLALAHDALRAAPAGVLVGMARPFGADGDRVDDEVRYFERAQAFLEATTGRMPMVARLLFDNTPLVCSSCLVKRETFMAVGGFDDTLPLFEDLEFYLRAIRLHGWLYWREPILERRVGGVTLISAARRDEIDESYRLIHRRYRQHHSLLEFAALKASNAWSRLGAPVA